MDTKIAQATRTSACTAKFSCPIPTIHRYTIQPPTDASKHVADF